MATSNRGDPQKNSSEKLAKQAQQAIEEARMVLPGIQALFGFQLIAVFNTTFGRLTQGQQYLHYLSVVLIAVANTLAVAARRFSGSSELGSDALYCVDEKGRQPGGELTPLKRAMGGWSWRCVFREGSGRAAFLKPSYLVANSPFG